MEKLINEYIFIVELLGHRVSICDGELIIIPVTPWHGKYASANRYINWLEDHSLDVVKVLNKGKDK